jgi:Ca2+-binding RTX toxin-like protein
MNETLNPLALIASGRTRSNRLAAGAAAALATAVISAATLLAPAGPALAAVTCNFKTVTILGTDGADTIVGTAGPDVILAGGGDDVIQGLGGDDTVCPGPGNDRVSAGAGNDLIDMEPVVDGNDLLTGGSGQDSVLYARRTLGANISVDGRNNDGGSNEFDNVGTDIESVTTGSGGDVLTGNDGPNILNGNGGADLINGAGGNDDLFGDLGNDVINGGLGNDSIDGGQGDDQINADATADGADFVFGGFGSDTMSYRARTASVFVTLDGVSDDGAAGEADNIETDVENLTGGLGGDVLRIAPNPGGNGVFANNVFRGGPGQDIIDVADGPFVTNDVADGGNDVDVCRFDPQLDQVFNCEL